MVRIQRVALVAIQGVQYVGVDSARAWPVPALKLLSRVLLTSSKDGCCRLWDMQGSFIGTLGQAIAFDVGQANTWQASAGP